MPWGALLVGGWVGFVVGLLVAYYDVSRWLSGEEREHSKAKLLIAVLVLVITVSVFFNGAPS